MRSLVAPLVCGVLLTVACGGHSTLPIAPTPPGPPTVAYVSIVGPSLIQAGSSATYTVTVSFSSGPPVLNATPTTWSSDDAAVATIDGGGRLTAHARGTATISAIHQGVSGTFKVRVPVDASDPLPGGAHMVISFKPDPAPGSPTTCDYNSRWPSWTFLTTYTETQGVGFTVKEDILNFFTDDGLLRTWAFFDNYYFAPHAQFEEEFCTTLKEPGGFIEEALAGVDDQGNQVAFISKRLRLLPVAGASPASSAILPVPPTSAPVIRRTRHRVR